MIDDTKNQFGYTERTIRLRRKGRNQYAWFYDNGKLYSPIFHSTLEAKEWMGEPGILKITPVPADNG